jgi:hypothetical protein
MRQTRVTILLIAVCASVAAQTDPPGRVGRLNYSNGPVSFQPVPVGWIGEGTGGSGFGLCFSFGDAAAAGWFPRGPREPCFPAHRVSSSYFGWVNRTNTMINTTIRNSYSDSQNPNNLAFNNIRYANRTVKNAVAAVPQDRFVNGRRVAERARAVSSAELGTVRYRVSWRKP